MEQVAWTALGLLGTGMFATLAMLFQQGRRIDALGTRLGERIDSQGERIDALGERIDAQGARLDARIDSLSGLLQAHIERHAG